MFNLDFGLTTIDGNVVPGIGIHKSFSKDLKENTRGNLTVGVMNVVPYLAAGVSISNYKNPSASEMLTATAKTYGLTLNFSPAAWGATASFRNSVSETISENETGLRAILTKFTGIKNIAEIDKLDLNADLPDGKKLTEVDIKLIKNTIKTDLNVFGMASLGRVLEAYVTTLKEHQVRNASKDGSKFSGANLGVQFIGGFFPIPVAGVSWEKIDVKYATNQKEALNDNMRRLDPKAAHNVTQSEFQSLLRHELGDDKALVTKNPDGSISFKKPAHLNIQGLAANAIEIDGIVTIKSGTQIRTWDSTGTKDAEFSIFLAEAPVKIDITQFTDVLSGTGITVSEKGGKLHFLQGTINTEVDIKGKSVKIEEQKDGSHKMTVSSSTDPKALTTITKEGMNVKIDKVSALDQTWESNTMNEIYDTKTQKAMFDLRLQDGPKFKEYRETLAEMIKRAPRIENAIVATQSALIKLIDSSPKLQALRPFVT